MIHSIKNHSPTHRRGQPFLKKLLLPAAGLFLTCSSCTEAPPAPRSLPVTDTTPVGDGLKVIGFAMLGAAVVLVLGRLLR